MRVKVDRQVDATVRKDRCAAQFHLPPALEWKHPCGTELQNRAACGVCGITEGAVRRDGVL